LLEVSLLQWKVHKHMIYAARCTCAHLELPGITEAVEQHNWKTLQDKAAILERALVENTALIEQGGGLTHEKAMTKSTPQFVAHRSPLLLRSYRKQYPTATRGEGVYIWDSQGNRYLDFSSSAVVNFIGHGIKEVADAIAAQARQLEFVHSSQFITEAADRFARELLGFLGPAYREAAVFFTSGGSEAVETALKLARQYHVEMGNNQRSQVFSRKQSYHGATIGAMAVSDNVRRREIYRPMLREFVHVGTPYCYRCPYGCSECASKHAAELEQALSEHQEKVAAFIYEPLSGATLGAAIPPPGYLERVHEICAHYGVLTIADEVMTGMGRTGRPLASTHWGVTPDIVVLGKGLASGYAPLGAAVAARKIVDTIANGSGALVHGFTYSAHSISVAAGRAVLKVIRDRQLVRAADDMGSGPARHLKNALQGLRDLQCVGDVRGMGLMWGIEFVKNRSTMEPFPVEQEFAGLVAQACTNRGVLVYPMQGCADGYRGDHVMIAPPATITNAEIDDAVERVIKAIQDSFYAQR
jgi:adenosylmethionine-8-amino-7-oxononanoate aminotransferase